MRKIVAIADERRIKGASIYVIGAWRRDEMVRANAGGVSFNEADSIGM